MSSYTIKDVADRAGVSIATVSAVINSADWVSDATRDRVLSVIESIGYRPNRAARSLKKAGTSTVGTIVSDLTNPFFTELVRALSHELHASGRTLLLCDADHRFELGERHFNVLLEERVDAIVLIGDSVHEDVLASYVRQRRRVPIIAIERDYELPEVSTLLVDSEDASYRATHHLVQLGYRRIAHISGPKAGPGSTTFGRAHRLEGYMRALRDAQLEIDEALIVPGNFRFDGGNQAMKHLLSLDSPPDAVFCANDVTAFGAIGAARSMQLRVPDDIAVVGFDDIPAAEVVVPSLTTMRMPTTDLGKAAAALVDEVQSTGRRLDTVRRMFDASLHIRGSAPSTSVEERKSSPSPTTVAR